MQIDSRSSAQKDCWGTMQVDVTERTSNRIRGKVRALEQIDAPLKAVYTELSGRYQRQPSAWPDFSAPPRAQR